MKKDIYFLGHDAEYIGIDDNGYGVYQCKHCKCRLASMPGKYEGVYFQHSTSKYNKHCKYGDVPSCLECKMEDAIL